MYEKLKALLAKQLRVDPEKITPEATIKGDLGADSLDVLQILMAMEDEYGVTIPDEELVNFSTVADILAYVEKLGL